MSRADRNPWLAKMRKLMPTKKSTFPVSYIWVNLYFIFKIKMISKEGQPTGYRHNEHYVASAIAGV